MWKSKSVEVEFNAGVISVKGTWEPNDLERRAAWDLYVELITRVSVEELRSGEGILREALDSLYSIFDSTRVILKTYGTEVAKPRKKANDYSFGQLAIIILNKVLRPFLTKWHPLLEEYESKRPGSMSIKEHEDKWQLNSQMRTDLHEVRRVLIKFSYFLAIIADVIPLWGPAEESDVW